MKVSKIHYKEIFFDKFNFDWNIDIEDSCKHHLKLSLNWKDTFWSFFKIYNWKWTNRKFSHRNRNIQIYKEGVKEFSSELDWVSIINSIRKLNKLIEPPSESSNQPISRIFTKSLQIDCPISNTDKCKIHSKLKA